MTTRNPDDEALVEAFVQEIERLGWSQSEVEERVSGVTQSDVSRWVRGEWTRLTGAKRRSLRAYLDSNELLGVGEAPPAYGRESRATAMLEMLDRGSEIRRFDGHLGAGSLIAMANAEADAREWTREELRESLEYAAKWALEQERELSRLHQEIRRRDREHAPDGGS